jgi:hypothetical protein
MLRHNNLETLSINFPTFVCIMRRKADKLTRYNGLKVHDVFLNITEFILNDMSQEGPAVKGLSQLRFALDSTTLANSIMMYL